MKPARVPARIELRRCNFAGAFASLLRSGMALAIRRPPEVIVVTPQEEQLLNSLVERVNQTQLQEKDPDAEALLNRSLGPNPDALYILAQTVLVQNIALEQARAQVTQRQQQARQPAHATSFLGSLLGHRDPEPPPQAAQPAYQPVNPQYTQQYTQSTSPPQDAQPQYQQPEYIASGPPSFLRGAMQTAAGVAAGALAFEGVEAVLHGLGGHPGYGWGGGGFGMGPVMGGGLDRPVEETVVNNYYDDPNAQGGEHHGFERGGEQHFHESADQFGAHLTDASYNTADDRNEVDANNADRSRADDSANFDNSAFDDSNVDEGSGFDDSGGGFDSGGDVL
jgi:hypothetical protein